MVFDSISDEEMKAVENRLNHRPRKRLKYKTPYEAFFKLDSHLDVECRTLIPDLLGDFSALKVIIRSRPMVISHNMETVHSLYPAVRLKSNYFRSLSMIESIKLLDARIKSKSGIMVGLGEEEDEVIELMKDLRRVGCNFLTIGQYLAPSQNHYSVKEYVTPKQFERYGEMAKKLGFSFVTSAPFVRSSYKANEALQNVTRSIAV